jgi:alpha-tubulin suppressor-like RCC1 family protein
MPNQFFSPEGDLENYFVSEYWLLEQYVNSKVWAWGNNSTAQLGINDATNRSTPVTISAGATTWKQVSSGGFHTAAVKTDGTLWTWGYGGNGRLGTNDIITRSTPVTTFAGGTNWKQVSCHSGLSGGHMAAVKTDGTLWMWGFNGDGQLGNFAITDRSTPVTTFAGGTTWKQVSSGDRYTAAVKTDGTLWTWGLGGSGQLGTNATVSRSTPVTTFVGGTTWKQVSAAGTSTAAVKTDGTLWTWGTGTSGQLGVNDTSQKNSPVTTFVGGTDWKQVTCGGYHTVAIKTDGTLWSWGASNSGQLGRVALNVQYPVTTFAGGTNWADTATTDPAELYTLSAGNFYTAAIKTDGTLWTWGNNANGQLGNFTITTRSTPVTTFAGGTTWKQVSSGNSHTAAVKTDGTLWTWGNNINGRLGVNDVTNRSTPVTTFAGGTDWKQVSSGTSHTAAIKTDGTLWTWGSGGNGQLGRPTTFAVVPVATFAGGTNWADTATTDPAELYTLSAGYRYTAAVKTDGTLWTWGNNTSAQLGNNAATDRSTPVTTFAGGTTWKQVSSGQSHTAAIKTDGTLWAWGLGTSGQLGTNDTTQRNSPVTTFVGGTTWKQVSGGFRNTAAIKTDGTLWTWGYNILGQLGRPTTFAAVPVTTFAGGTNWADTATTDPAELYTLSAGNLHTAAIKTDGTLWTWGNNTFGQLGNNAATDRSTAVTTFVGGTTWKQVSSGNSHTAAVKTDGTLWTWGNNTNGRLGVNDTSQKNSPVTTFAGGTDWKQVSSGTSHTAAIKTDGTLWSWGLGGNGQLGRPTTFAVVPVTTFAGGTNWADTATTDPAELYTLSAGYRHTAAVKTDGTLWTWGNNANGQLGSNDAITRSTAVTTFAGGTTWKQVSSGQSHTAAIKTDGTLWTWGNNSFTQLGVNDTTQRNSPVTTFVGGTTWKQVACGFRHTAAIKTDGTLWTWGLGTNGQLGTNDLTNRSTPVTTFAGGTTWKQVSSTNSQTAAVKTDGTLWTWGYGGSGQLGNNAATDRSTPVTTFAGGTDWKQVSSGNTHTSAIKTDGTLWTWGNNSSAQLGVNDATNRSTPVTTFAGGTTWKQITCGAFHTAAVKTDGTLWTWGAGTEGQLGVNNATNRSTPVTTFVGGTNWKQVSAGGLHTIALTDDGINKELYVFGFNSIAQLGINANSSIPSALDGTTWKQITCGGYHTAAVKTDGTLWMWGFNGSGQLGNSDVIDKYVPVTTFAGGTDWKQVNATFRSTAAIKTDGTLWTWGNGTDGQLGNNAATDRSTPVTTFVGGTTWKQVTCGSVHAAAVKTDGTLWTWGLGTSYGRLGTNDFITRSTPTTTFAGGTNWKQVSSGGFHTIALTDDGINKELYVFGSNNNAQLGINANSSIPSALDGTTWKQVSSGQNHTAAVKTDGTLWIWGYNNNGQHGTNDILNRYAPVTTFAGGTNWKQVSSGGAHTAAVKTDGTLWTWGSGGNGQLGNFATTDRSTPVTTFAGGTTWKQVSGGQLHTAAVKTDGTLWTWGRGTDAQLGNDSFISDRSTPVTTFAGGTTWKQVSAGGFHTVALTDDGINKELYVFGSNASAQLGINANASIPSVLTGTTWKQITCGAFHTAAVKTDGTLWAWGAGNDGRLGINDVIDKYVPVTTFAGGTNWNQVNSGYRHTAAIKTDGTLWTWGYGGSGRLGNNDTTIRSTPVTTFVGGTTWKQVTCGSAHAAAVKTDGTLWTWGLGSDGQLGTNDFITRSTPTTTFAGGTTWKQVSAGNFHTVSLTDDGINKELYVFGFNGGGLGVNQPPPSVPGIIVGTTWKQVSAKDSHTAAVKTDGTLWTWGYNSLGQLGTNDAITRFTPVTTFVGGTTWKQVSSGRNYTAATSIGTSVDVPY